MDKRYSRACFALIAFACMVTVNGAHAQTNVREEDFIATDRKGDLIVRDDRAGFGSAGQWAFSTEAGLSISRTTISDTDGAVTILIVQPSADYFVIRNLSVGATLGVTYTKTGDDKGTRFNIGPRVGYNLELSRLLSVWPKLGFSYAHTNQDAADEKANSFALNLYAPVMLHPASHFFAGFGPFLDTDLSGDARATTWGFKLTLGGWI